MSKGNVLLGVIAGLAAGAILGILFAPAKGSETRQKIGDKGKDLAEDLKSRFDHLIDGLAGEKSSAEEASDYNAK